MTAPTPPSASASASAASGADALFSGHSELAVLMRNTDWSKTSLGAPEHWPQSLRTIIRMMLASRYQMWMGWGPELNFFYNDAYRPTLGAKHPRSLGAPTRELWSEIWSDIASRIQHVLETGDATWDEGLLLFLERNGYSEETYHTFSYSPVFDDGGAIGGLLCVVTEETERIISERRLALVREFASRLATINTTADVMTAVEAVLAADSRDLPFALVYLFDDSAETATLAARVGMPAAHPAAVPNLALDDVTFWPMADVRAASQPVVVSPLPTTLAWPSGPWTHAPDTAIVMPIAQSGQPRPAGVFVAGVNPHRPNDEGYRSFLNLFVGQIAAGLANARAYETERRRAESLAELDRAKTVFFSNVSHEFRTPLTLMLGPLAELAEHDGLDPVVQEHLDRAQRNGARLLRLVNTLLDFSRIEAGRAQARYEPIDLAQYTRDLASVFESAMERAGLRLVVDCPPLGEPVYVDRTMWEKVVLNLVSNAFKFTMNGEISVSLHREPGSDSSRHGDRVVLGIRDTGTGIPEAELPHLFERFHRVEGVRGRTHEGSGIGLALVSELVKLHGGTVSVDSTPGQGSEFRVTVPFGREHLAADQIVEGETPVVTARGAAFLEEALRWLPHSATSPNFDTNAESVAFDADRIVVADDNYDMRAYISRLLQPRWSVEVVENGREALDAIRRKVPQLVITDLMMPELDGVGLIQALRADPQTRELPILVLSARAGEEARIDGLLAGADDYLVKPFSARDLIARVHTQLVRTKVRVVEQAHATRLANVFEHAPVGVATLRGPEHVFEFANRAYRSLVADRALVGAPIRQALPELEGQGIFELLDHVYSSGEPHIGRSLRLLIHRGWTEPVETFFDFVYQPLRDDGHVTGIAVVCFEVTELATARRAAESASRAKDEFLAMLGHELRNPLAPILTALQMMRLRGISGAERERTVIERQVKHLVGLVDDLLDVSRITRGKVQLKRERIDLSDVVAKAIEMTSPAIDERHHSLGVRVDRELWLDGDPARLAQVLANLLTNAAKYTDEGGVIRIVAAREDDKVAVSVIDNGTGIAPSMLPRVFDMFAQEYQDIDRSDGGLGLGLSIVRSLIEAHNGSVSAASEGKGTGSTFTIRLPLAAGPLETSVPSAPVNVPGEVGRRVLVVDDNRDATELLADALRALGHTVRIALDGPAALEVVQTFHPEVALLDLGLPVMDGFELAQRLRSEPRLERIELIAVTGYGQDIDRRRTSDAGFDAHLIKPVDLEQLDALIRTRRE